jgi:nucleoid DNA-binding protein
MTKKDIVKSIADKLGLTQVETKEVVQCTLETIVESIIGSGGIELRNFGVFRVKQRAQRKARNPRTGEEVIVPPKKVVIFRPGRLLEKKAQKAKLG